MGQSVRVRTCQNKLAEQQRASKKQSKRVQSGVVKTNLFDEAVRLLPLARFVRLAL